MKLVTLSLLTAALAIPAGADLLDQANQVVDKSNQSATTKADSTAGAVNTSVTNTLGAGVVADSVNAKTAHVADQGKTKSNAAATKAKGKIQTLKTQKAQTVGSASDAVRQVESAAMEKESKAMDAVAPTAK